MFTCVILSYYHSSLQNNQNTTKFNEQNENKLNMWEHFDEFPPILFNFINAYVSTVLHNNCYTIYLASRPHFGPRFHDTP